MKWVVTQMKVNKLRDSSSEELMRKVEDLKAELFNLRFQMATGQLENPTRIKEVRKNIARVKTIIRERELKEERA
jgi:large subunit ribosomal protein L29